MKQGIAAIVLIGAVLSGCSDRKAASESAAKHDNNSVSDVGIGPVQRIELGAIDSRLAEKGKAIFEQKCAACHKFEERYVGPALKGVTQRRKPEWIMNMILNPSEMLEKDQTAKELLATYLTPMTFQDISKEQARAILEYFRQVDGAK
ncbi:MAG: cytochrome c [Chlorobi bacterium]|nr:cytochrome c [Chlorobiota bacterium]